MDIIISSIFAEEETAAHWHLSQSKSVEIRIQCSLADSRAQALSHYIPGPEINYHTYQLCDCTAQTLWTSVSSSVKWNNNTLLGLAGGRNETTCLKPRAQCQLSVKGGFMVIHGT